MLENKKDEYKLYELEVIKVKGENIARVIIETAEQKEITTICTGKPHLGLFDVILSTAIFNQLLKKLSSSDIDLVILS